MGTAFKQHFKQVEIGKTCSIYEFGVFQSWFRKIIQHIQLIYYLYLPSEFYIQSIGPAAVFISTNITLKPTSERNIWDGKTTPKP